MLKIQNKKCTVLIIVISVIGICFDFGASNFGFPRLSHGDQLD